MTKTIGQLREEVIKSVAMERSEFPDWERYFFVNQEHIDTLKAHPNTLAYLLSVAINNNHMPLLDALLALEPDPNHPWKRTKNNETFLNVPIMDAIERRHMQAYAALRKAGARLDVIPKCWDSYTSALDFANDQVAVQGDTVGFVQEQEAKLYLRILHDAFSEGESPENKHAQEIAQKLFKFDSEYFLPGLLMRGFSMNQRMSDGQTLHEHFNTGRIHYWSSEDPNAHERFGDTIKTASEVIISHALAGWNPLSDDPHISSMPQQYEHVLPKVFHEFLGYPIGEGDSLVAHIRANPMILIRAFSANDQLSELMHPKHWQGDEAVWLNLFETLYPVEQESLVRPMIPQAQIHAESIAGRKPFQAWNASLAA